MSIAEKAKHVYEGELKAQLEVEHCNAFVAIEPVSKSFFLGDTFIDAAHAAKKAHPDVVDRRGLGADRRPQIPLVVVVIGEERRDVECLGGAVARASAG